MLYGGWKGAQIYVHRTRGGTSLNFLVQYIFGRMFCTHTTHIIWLFFSKEPYAPSLI